jgi:hypothetical protein
MIRTLLFRPLSKLALFAIGSVGCSEPETETKTDPIPEPPDGSLLADPSVPFPKRLSETGLYPLAPDLASVPKVVHGYVPAWELWSSGLSKLRHIIIPKGKTVDTADAAAWEFPTGTLFFKTFSDDDGPVETRVLRLKSDGWEFGSYLWNDDATDADLLDEKGANAEVTVKGDSFTHAVPSRLECRQCHESSPSPVLGFNELRLNHVVSEEESELARLSNEQVLSANPASPEAIEDSDELRRAVRGYLHGNCSYCHNGTMGPSSSYDLRHDVALKNTIGVETDSSATAAGLRISPGKPAESILFLALSGETDDPEVKAMPPLAVERRDKEAIELLRTFIESLPEEM